MKLFQKTLYSQLSTSTDSVQAVVKICTSYIGFDFAQPDRN